MSSVFPSILTSYTSPAATDRLNSPSHSGIETNQNSGLTALETFVGTLSSVSGTLMYDIRSASSNGGGHVQAANTGGTGQTVFTKGDILIGQSSSVLSKLSVGSDNKVITADSSQTTGIRWSTVSDTIGKPNIIVASVAGVTNWTKPSLLSYVIVEVVGGGGGGGGAATNNTSGGGGGAGGYARKRVSASVLGSTENMVVGAGGAGGASGNNDGVAGNTTTFGATSIISATGGDLGSSSGNSSAGGVGGVGSSNSDLFSQGGAGSAGHFSGTSGIPAGKGGDSYFGGGAFSHSSESAGVAGIRGGGGSGGLRASSNQPGGAGGAGVIVVTEYF